MELVIRYQHTFMPGFERTEERMFMHYSNLEGILLVGEGDFSFSSVLAKAFGFACNMVATSLDRREKLLTTYQNARQNLCDLERLGALMLHGVDATAMDKLEAFRERMFDKIIYNFPHAGFWGSEDDKPVIKKHRRLVKMFFKSAKTMLSRRGEIHVTHKEKEPYNKWKLEKQAKKSGLFLKEAVDFHTEDYPGYTNRRGQGANCGGTFFLGACKTYKFISSDFFYESLYLLQVKPKFARGNGSSCKSRKRKHTPNEEGSMLCSLMGIQWPRHFEDGYGFPAEMIESCRPVKRSRHEPFEEGYVPFFPPPASSRLTIENAQFSHGIASGHHLSHFSSYGDPGRRHIGMHINEGILQTFRPLEKPLPILRPPASLRLTIEDAHFSQGISSGRHFSHFSHGDPVGRQIAMQRNERILQTVSRLGFTRY